MQNAECRIQNSGVAPPRIITIRLQRKRLKNTKYFALRQIIKAEDNWMQKAFSLLEDVSCILREKKKA